MGVTGFSHWGDIAKALEESAAVLPEEGAKLVVSETRKFAPELTGNLKRSEYYRTLSKSTYAQGDIDHEKLLPEVPAPHDKYTAYAAAGAVYSRVANNGYHNRAAHPFWEPGIAAARPLFEEKIHKLLSAIERAAHK